MSKFKTNHQSHQLVKTLVAISVLTLGSSAYSAEMRTHFASAGTLGENIFSSDINPGSFVGIGYKKATADSLVDGSGTPITRLGATPIPLSYHNDINVKYIYAGFTSQDKYADGNISLSIAVPYTSNDKLVTGGPFPAYGVMTPTSLPNSSAKFSKLDDIEVGSSWDFKKSDATKYSVGLALTTKTGDFQVAGNGGSVGVGYYTLKPSFASITQDGPLSYAYKASLV